MNYHTTTTLNEIKVMPKPLPYLDWLDLLLALGKTEADDEPVDISEILQKCGVHVARLCLGAASLDRFDRHYRANMLSMFVGEGIDDLIVSRVALLRNDEMTSDVRNKLLQDYSLRRFDEVLGTEGLIRANACRKLMFMFMLGELR